MTETSDYRYDSDYLGDYRYESDYLSDYQYDEYVYDDPEDDGVPEPADELTVDGYEDDPLDLVAEPLTGHLVDGGAIRYDALREDE
jgi:hypothetical protein